MSVHISFNLLNELRKSDTMRGLPSNLSLFCNEFNRINITRYGILDYVYQMTSILF